MCDSVETTSKDWSELLKSIFMNWVWRIGVGEFESYLRNYKLATHLRIGSCRRKNDLSAASSAPEYHVQIFLQICKCKIFRNDKRQKLSCFYLGLVDKLHHPMNLLRVHVTKGDDGSLPAVIPHPTRPFSLYAQRFNLETLQGCSRTTFRALSLITCLAQRMTTLGSTKEVSKKSSFICLDVAQTTTQAGSWSAGSGDWGDGGHDTITDSLQSQHSSHHNSRLVCRGRISWFVEIIQLFITCCCYQTWSSTNSLTQDKLGSVESSGAPGSLLITELNFGFNRKCWIHVSNDINDNIYSLLDNCCRVTGKL